VNNNNFKNLQLWQLNFKAIERGQPSVVNGYTREKNSLRIRFAFVAKN
jgi:hypothetical protein